MHRVQPSDEDVNHLLITANVKLPAQSSFGVLDLFAPVVKFVPQQGDDYRKKHNTLKTYFNVIKIATPIGSVNNLTSTAPVASSVLEAA